MAEENTQGQGQGQPSRQAARRTMARRSAVYEHFTCFTDAQGNDKAKCKYCSLVLGANTRNGTSSLRTHVRICKNARGVGGGATAAASDGESHRASLAPSSAPPLPPLLLPSGPGESSAVKPAAGMQAEEEASRDLARMITLDGYDPSVVDNKYFRSFLRRLNPQFEVPSRRAIDKMCSEIFGDQRSDDLVYLLEDDDTRKVSLAVGQSKIIEPAGQVVYLTTHFIDHDWNLHRLLHDVCLAGDGDHYHFPLRRVPVVSLDKAVDHIVSELDTLSSISNITYDQLFMILGEMTGHIDHLKLKDRMEQEFGINPIYSTTYMDHVLHSIARCLLPHPDFAKFIFDYIEEMRDELPRKHQGHLTQLGLLDDPWEYDELWYSCYCSMEILYTLPVESNDSELLLRTLWREIYRAIRRVSDSSHPTSHVCLQELFKVRDALQTQLSEAHAGRYCSVFGDKNVADVLREALDTVDKAIGGSYLVWSIPLVLDPRYKLGYIKFNFERAFGPEAGNYYTSEATRKIKELYTTSYYIEDDDEDSDGSIEEMVIDSTTRLEQAWDDYCRSQDGTGKVGTHAKAHADELDRYLEDRLAPRTESFDILNWWKENSSRYPTVARMARDALAMPTCSKLTSDQIAHVRSRLRGYHQRYGW